MLSFGFTPFLVSFYLASTTTAFKNLDEVWVVRMGLDPEKDRGSCERTYRTVENVEVKYVDTLHKFWDDTAKLISHAHDGLQKIAEDSHEGRQVRNNLLGWFGVGFDKQRKVKPDRAAQLKQIEKTFDQLVDLINGDEVKGLHELEENRRIYCNTDWAAYTEVVYDMNGVAQTKTDSQGRTVPKNMHDPQDYQNPHGEGLSRPGQSSRWEQYAYWVPDYKGYFFLGENDHHPENPADPPPRLRHFCNRIVLAGTDDLSIKGVISVSFCPRAFTTYCDPAQKQKCYDTSDESSKNRRVGGVLRLRQPRSLTMLHEFVHVVIGTPGSPDHINGVELYGVPNVLDSANKGHDHSTLPDAYAYFAYAYWLGTVKENPNNPNEKLLDWSSGKAKRMDESS